ncbi:MAG: membrane dipeptidase [Oscillospiraceae bacterium]
MRTAAGAEQAREQGQIYAFFAIEGMAAIGEDLTGINRYADFGARIGMLTWNETNALATGAGGDRYSPLTDLGRQAVTRMQNLGMLPDVSHLNDGGFADVIHLASGPVIASHSNCRALCDVRRNLTDDQLRAIRDTGGVVGVNVYHGFVHADPEQQTAEMLARHAAHMADVMGVEHVACGFRLLRVLRYGKRRGPGPGGLRGNPGLFFLVGKAGDERRERAMVARENFLRVLA